MFSFAIDYKFIDGKIIIFELGNTFHSSQVKVKELYETEATQQILKDAESYANAKKMQFNTDYTKPQPFNKEFYESDLSNGLIISRDASTATRYSIYASPEKIICNANITPFLNIKWLFDYLCQNEPKLKDYIPKTYFVTKATFDEIKNQLPDNEYYLKPSNGSQGRGIQILAKSELDAEKILSFFQEDPENITANMTEDFAPEHYLFLLQEKITGDIIKEKNKKKTHERTRRVFVTVYGDLNKPETLEITLSHPYFRIPKKAGNKGTGCEYPENKHFYKSNLTEIEEEKIKQFSRLFLMSSYNQLTKCFPKLWENMLSDFLQEFNGKGISYNKNSRQLKISQIGHALVQEQAASFEKIDDFHVKKLNEFYKLLSLQERSFFDPYLFHFFVYTLIGTEERHIPENYVNTNLISLFKVFIEALSEQDAINAVSEDVMMAKEQAQRINSPTKHNLKVLEELEKLCTEKIRLARLNASDQPPQMDQQEITSKKFTN